MSLLPPEDELELLHTRNYEVKVYLVDEDTVLVRGAVSDVKPGGLYIRADPDPIEIHQMHVSLTVALPGLVISGVNVDFETHPNSACPTITDHYRELIGLSVARGFTHKVRELFGGPRGCTHTTALLQAMAPAVVQSTWSVGVRKRANGQLDDDEQAADRDQRAAGNLNTCHVWAEDGEHVLRLRRGEKPEPLIPLAERLASLGRSPEDWP